MSVIFYPFSDGYAIVGYIYKCLKCGDEGMFSSCCENCDNDWDEIDQDEWYELELKKQPGERAWDKVVFNTINS